MKLRFLAIAFACSAYSIAALAAQETPEFCLNVRLVAPLAYEDIRLRLEADAVRAMQEFERLKSSGLPEATQHEKTQELIFNFEKSTAGTVAALPNERLYLYLDEWIARRNKERGYLPGLKQGVPVHSLEDFIVDMLKGNDGAILLRNTMSNLATEPELNFSTMLRQTRKPVSPEQAKGAFEGTLDFAVFAEFRRRLFAGTWDFSSNPGLLQRFMAERDRNSPLYQIMVRNFPPLLTPNLNGLEPGK